MNIKQEIESQLGNNYLATSAKKDAHGNKFIFILNKGDNGGAGVVGKITVSANAGDEWIANKIISLLTGQQEKQENMPSLGSIVDGEK